MKPDGLLPRLHALRRPQPNETMEIKVAEEGTPRVYLAAFADARTGDRPEAA